MPTQDILKFQMRNMGPPPFPGPPGRVSLLKKPVPCYLSPKFPPKSVLKSVTFNFPLNFSVSCCSQYQVLVVKFLFLKLIFISSVLIYNKKKYISNLL